MHFESAYVCQKLHDQQRAAHAHRLRYSGSLLTVGTLAFVAGQAIGLTQGVAPHWNNEHPPVYIWTVVAQLGSAIMLLSLRPCDTRSIRIAAMLLSLLCVYYVILIVGVGQTSAFDTPFVASHSALLLFNSVFWGTLFLRAVPVSFRRPLQSLDVRSSSVSMQARSQSCGFYIRSQRRALEWMWLTFRGTLVSFAVVDFSFAMFVYGYQAAEHGTPDPEPEAEPKAEPEAEPPPERDATPESTVLELDSSSTTVASVAIASGLLILLALALSKRNRRRLEAILAMMDRKGESQAAATISAMIGRMEPKAAFDFASRSFRGINFELLHEDDLANAREEAPWRKQSEPLASHSEPRRLGEVDAFVSHTWHDDSQARFKALQSWARDFAAMPLTPLPSKGRQGSWDGTGVRPPAFGSPSTSGPVSGKEKFPTQASDRSDHSTPGMPIIWFDKACLNWDDVSNRSRAAGSRLKSSLHPASPAWQYTQHLPPLPPALASPGLRGLHHSPRPP